MYGIVGVLKINYSVECLIPNMWQKSVLRLVLLFRVYDNQQQRIIVDNIDYLMNYSFTKHIFADG